MVWTCPDILTPLTDIGVPAKVLVTPVIVLES
jgi:hypothetical protein